MFEYLDNALSAALGQSFAIKGSDQALASASAQPMAPQLQGRPLNTAGMCPPKQPACACLPRSNLPSIIATPPMPVPKVIITTSVKPRAGIADPLDGLRVEAKRFINWQSG